MVVARRVGRCEPNRQNQYRERGAREAGLEVEAVRLLALQDRNLHNRPPYAYNVYKAFVLCEIKGGSFRPNIETQGSVYFALDELPPLSEDKVTREQIVLCFEAVQADDWVVPFD